MSSPDAAETALAASPAVSGENLGRPAGDMVWRVGPPVVVFLLGILAWIALHYILPADKALTIPLPWEVLKIGVFNWANFSNSLTVLSRSATTAVIGLFFTILVGFAFAIAMSQAKWVENALLPYAIAMQAAPILALVPLIGVIIGFNQPSRVLVVILISVFAFLSNVLFGLLSADKGSHDLLTLHDANRYTRLVKLQLPAAMPSVFTGLRVASVMAVVGAVVGDFFFTQGNVGLGQSIQLAANQLQYEVMFTDVFLAIALGVVAYVIVVIVEAKTIGRWHSVTRAS